MDNYYSMSYTNTENKRFGMGVEAVTELNARNFTFAVAKITDLIYPESGNNNYSYVDYALQIAKRMCECTAKARISINTDLPNEDLVVIVHYQDKNGDEQFSRCFIRRVK